MERRRGTDVIIEARPMDDALFATTNTEFARIVRAESHARALRMGTLTCMSRIAWESGFPRGRRVLLTSAALRLVTQRGSAVDPGDLTALLDERTARLLVAAAQVAKRGKTTASDRFTVALDDDLDAQFVIRVEAFGSSAPVLVIDDAYADPDAVPSAV